MTSAEVDAALADRARRVLEDAARGGVPVTYRQVAAELSLRPPHTIHRVTRALEALMHEDAERGRPMIAAMVVGKARRGMPAPGFFECARRLGRYDGPASGPEAEAFHAAELQACIDYWGGGLTRGTAR